MVQESDLFSGVLLLNWFLAAPVNAPLLLLPLLKALIFSFVRRETKCQLAKVLGD